MLLKRFLLRFTFSDFAEQALAQFVVHKLTTTEEMIFFRKSFISYIRSIAVAVCRLSYRIVEDFNSITSLKQYKFNHHSISKILWTILPVLLLVCFAVPLSFSEGIDPEIVVKVVPELSDDTSAAFLNEQKIIASALFFGSLLVFMYISPAYLVWRLGPAIASSLASADSVLDSAVDAVVGAASAPLVISASERAAKIAEVDAVKKAMVKAYQVVGNDPTSKNYIYTEKCGVFDLYIESTDRIAAISKNLIFTPENMEHMDSMRDVLIAITDLLSR